MPVAFSCSPYPHPPPGLWQPKRSPDIAKSPLGGKIAQGWEPLPKSFIPFKGWENWYIFILWPPSSFGRGLFLGTLSLWNSLTKHAILVRIKVHRQRFAKYIDLGIYSKFWGYMGGAQATPTFCGHLGICFIIHSFCHHFFIHSTNVYQRSIMFWAAGKTQKILCSMVSKKMDTVPILCH